MPTMFKMKLIMLKTFAAFELSVQQAYCRISLSGLSAIFSYRGLISKFSPNCRTGFLCATPKHQLETCLLYLKGSIQVGASLLRYSSEAIQVLFCPASLLNSPWGKYNICVHTPILMLLIYSSVQNWQINRMNNLNFHLYFLCFHFELLSHKTFQKHFLPFDLSTPLLEQHQL